MPGGKPFACKNTMCTAESEASEKSDKVCKIRLQDKQQQSDYDRAVSKHGPTQNTKRSKNTQWPQKNIQTYTVALIFALAACAPQAKTIASEVFDTVIEGGRVMDPETNYDAIANIGIRQGIITRISIARLKGNRRIDAKGLVVSPGFIDIHSHNRGWVTNSAFSMESQCDSTSKQALTS